MVVNWCGDFGLWDWRFGQILSPCWLESCMSASALLVVVVIFLFSIAKRAQADQPAERHIKGMTGFEFGYFSLAIILGLLHITHLVISVISFRGQVFHIAYQAVLAGVWLIIAANTWYCSRRHELVDWRPFLGFVVVIYVWLLVTYMQLYYHPMVYPLHYLKAQIWTLILQVSISILLLVLTVRHFRRTKSPEGYSAIGDVETGDANKRTWVRLFVDACAYVWPEQLGLQLRVVLCFILLVSMRVINLAVPILYKKLVDQLSSATYQDPQYRPSFAVLVSPWVLLYLAAIFFQGGAGGGIIGFINNLRSYIWIPVSQDTYRRISLMLFRHILDLDLNFHLKRKTGEVTKVVDRGTSAIQNVLSTIVFSILPQIFDVMAAATYLSQALDPYIAIIVFITVGSYIPLTVIVTEWRGSIRRDMNKTDNAKSARATDALLNYETVKYFNNEDYEQREYSRAIAEYQVAEYRFTASLNVLNVVQSLVMFAGVASGMLVCTAGVAKGTFTVGDTVLFLTLMTQLYAPLNFFGTYYRIIQQYMIDMENMFDLLDKNTAVADDPGAKPLVVAFGSVAYQDVSFWYEPSAPVVKNVSFFVPGGNTLALVGATGSGKSTVTRLLFRFYDVKSGSILVDGQDIRRVTQHSLRSIIAMVPQDTVLFNDTILHNIRYGRITATDEEVYEAARAAAIHDTIVDRFPQGYNTVVGERGLRLSGGEKQRVAFARAILKNPVILVLDEATSALDSITEKKIQEALHTLREVRTTLIVAHRLSTIADAHEILVMKEGRVEESGTHQQLLEKPQGAYREMWTRQQHHQPEEGASEGNRPQES